MLIRQGAVFKVQSALTTGYVLCVALACWSFSWNCENAISGQEIGLHLGSHFYPFPDNNSFSDSEARPCPSSDQQRSKLGSSWKVDQGQCLWRFILRML